jgi:hypothetical protein
LALPTPKTPLDQSPPVPTERADGMRWTEELHTALVAGPADDRILAHTREIHTL